MRRDLIQMECVKCVVSSGVVYRVAIANQISCWTWNWTKKLFFHLLDLAILNSYILLSSRGGKKVSQTFSTHPSKEHAGSGWTRMTVRDLRDTTLNVSRLDTICNKHWPGPSVVCALWEVWHEKFMWYVLSVMWPYVSIKHALRIIIQRSDCKASSRATSVHKVEACNQNVSERKGISTNF
jgi:hypothetical protein